MTGAEHRAMTFRKHVPGCGQRRILTRLPVLLALLIPPALQADEVITLTLNITSVRPPCDVTFPDGSTVALGRLYNRGTQTHSAIRIRMTCADTSSVPELWATAGALVDGTTNEAQMKSTGSATGKPVRLFLNNADGNKVPLNGKETGTTDGFCKGGMNNSTTRDCTLTPVTISDEGTVKGNVSGTILFGVRHT